MARRGWRTAMTAAAIAGAGAMVAAVPAAAQFSESFNFMKAVKDRDVAKAKEAMDRPGSLVVNTRDDATGQTPLELVTRAHDLGWMALLLQNGARADLRDRDGDTALAAATRIGFVEGARMLISVGAPVNLANNQGETPLIIAVRNHDPVLTRALLEVGADPRQRDSIAGLSARDYAAQDPRSAPLLKMIDSVRTAPPKAISGPH